MNPKMSISKLSGAAAALLVLVTTGCTGQAYCDKIAECASDPPGEDYRRVCAIQYDGQLRSLRANKEEECYVLASAKERYDACVAQLDCKDFRDARHNGACDDERDDFEDALDDAELECGTLD